MVVCGRCKFYTSPQRTYKIYVLRLGIDRFAGNFTVFCFFIYLAFSYLSQFGIFVGKNDYLVESFGLSAHYDAMGKGVIDTRDVVYFLSLISAFILFTRTALSARRW